tara:strand:- start:16493 stop:16867 length:375 start_codon:yes stop_codon:yes gene_type:complete
MKKNPHNIRMGRRNRQRGAELQRQVVRIAKDFGFTAFNRDRGGAQHEQGDVEIDDKYYGCKRRKSVPRWILPEKNEVGVFFRGDRMEPMIALSAETFFMLKKFAKSELIEGRQVTLPRGKAQSE